MSIKAQIMKVLAACAGFALTAPTLKLQVEMVFSKRVGEADFSKAIADLKHDGLIRTRKEPLSGETCWFKVAA